MASVAGPASCTSNQASRIWRRVRVTTPSPRRRARRRLLANASGHPDAYHFRHRKWWTASRLRPRPTRSAADGKGRLASNRTRTTWASSRRKEVTASDPRYSNLSTIPNNGPSGLGSRVSGRIPRTMRRGRSLPSTAKRSNGAGRISPSVSSSIRLMGRSPTNAATSRVAGFFKQFARRCHLDDPSGHEDGDPIRHAHGFGLIVCDVNEGAPGALVQINDLATHLGAQLGVQIGKRLVQQKNATGSRTRARPTATRCI